MWAWPLLDLIQVLGAAHLYTHTVASLHVARILAHTYVSLHSLKFHPGLLADLRINQGY